MSKTKRALVHLVGQSLPVLLIQDKSIVEVISGHVALLRSAVILHTHHPPQTVSLAATRHLTNVSRVNILQGCHRNSCALSTCLQFLQLLLLLSSELFGALHLLRGLSLHLKAELSDHHVVFFGLQTKPEEMRRNCFTPS